MEPTDVAKKSSDPAERASDAAERLADAAKRLADAAKRLSKCSADASECLADAAEKLADEAERSANILATNDSEFHETNYNTETSNMNEIVCSSSNDKTAIKIIKETVRKHSKYIAKKPLIRKAKLVLKTESHLKPPLVYSVVLGKRKRSPEKNMYNEVHNSKSFLSEERIPPYKSSKLIDLELCKRFKINPCSIILPKPCNGHITLSRLDFTKGKNGLRVYLDEPKQFERMSNINGIQTKIKRSSKDYCTFTLMEKNLLHENIIMKNGTYIFVSPFASSPSIKPYENSQIVDRSCQSCSISLIHSKVNYGLPRDEAEFKQQYYAAVYKEDATNVGVHKFATGGTISIFYFDNQNHSFRFKKLIVGAGIDLLMKYQELRRACNADENREPVPSKGSGKPAAHKGSGKPAAHKGSGKPAPRKGSGKRIPPKASGKRIPPKASGKGILPKGSGKGILPKGSGKQILHKGSGKQILHKGSGNPAKETLSNIVDTSAECNTTNISIDKSKVGVHGLANTTLKMFTFRNQTATFTYSRLTVRAPNSNGSAEYIQQIFADSSKYFVITTDSNTYENGNSWEPSIHPTIDNYLTIDPLHECDKCYIVYVLKTIFKKGNPCYLKHNVLLPSFSKSLGIVWHNEHRQEDFSICTSCKTVFRSFRSFYVHTCPLKPNIGYWCLLCDRDVDTIVRVVNHYRFHFNLPAICYAARF